MSQLILPAVIGAAIAVFEAKRRGPGGRYKLVGPAIVFAVISIPPFGAGVFLNLATILVSRYVTRIVSHRAASRRQPAAVGSDTVAA